MGKITVYHHWNYDGKTDESTLSPTKRTAAEIKRMGLKIAPETAEEVDESDLDDQGRYDPKKSEAKNAPRL
jgi:hypothetical protein